ncbi:RIB43A-like with coiled-coils protein 1 [Parambassis ranga]|uniref:RIB43A-like with coiled-coils protein 1 n=1 Tax=Parambassis ranga TaxID=210632 RepID=A0A6P7IDI5_9TELE|nr:RIB43A-like with coiled-coils protein 1 [Parambassis ranga]
MYNVKSPEEEAVERRRRAETARKARIFNARQRVIGINIEGLNQQVHEKKLQQHMEKCQDEAYDTLRKYQDKALLQQDLMNKKMQRELQIELTQYWAIQQQVEDSRDADLKHGHKGAFNITIPESKLGPASMQIFQGEGVGEEKLRREQTEQTEKDLQAQMEDNKRRHMEDKHKEMLVDRELVHTDLWAIEQAALEKERQKTTCIVNDSYNQVLAAERAEKLREQREAEERESLAHMFHTMTSDLMTECVEAADIQVGGGRPPQVLVNQWKGMNTEQLSTIHKQRDQQLLEKQKQRDAEKIQDAAWNLQLLKWSKDAEKQERRVAELKREQEIQMDRLNMQLAREQQAHQEYLNKKLYTNKPTKDYFWQFNTSSR